MNNTQPQSLVITAEELLPDGGSARHVEWNHGRIEGRWTTHEVGIRRRLGRVGHRQELVLNQEDIERLLIADDYWRELREGWHGFTSHVTAGGHGGAHLYWRPNDPSPERIGLEALGQVSDGRVPLGSEETRPLDHPIQLAREVRVEHRIVRAEPALDLEQPVQVGAGLSLGSELGLTLRRREAELSRGAATCVLELDEIEGLALMLRRWAPATS